MHVLSFAWLSARKLRLLGAGAVVLLGAGVMQFTSVHPAASQQARLTAYHSDRDPADPASGAWDGAAPLRVPLTTRFAGYGIGAGGTVTSVTAFALHRDGKLYLRVSWPDSTVDNTTTRAEDFSDAVAIEMPSRAASTIPAICMGQADAGVNIWQWRADSDQGSASADASHPNALVDGYPSQEDVFFPARAVGNPLAQPGAGAAQTLVAKAFGNLERAAVQDVAAKGKHADGRWTVVFSRQFDAADADQAALAEGVSSDLAFAVWDGSQGDRNGQKSVSTFVTLRLVPGARPGGVGGSSAVSMIFAVVLLAGGVGSGLALAFRGYVAARRERP